MVDNPTPTFGLSINDIQVRLAETTDRWMTFRDGRIAVNLFDLATVVHRISQVAIRRANAQHPHQAPGAYLVELVSFGYLHGAPPDADRIVDVRDTLRDPAAAREILDLDGRHLKVQAVVLNTAGAIDLVDELVTNAEQVTRDRPHRIAIGCAGGRHRSVALIEIIGGLLRDSDVPVSVEHRDVHRPRVLKSTTSDDKTSGGDPR